MNVRTFLLVFSIFIFSSINAQVFWTEDFDGTPCAAGSGCDPSIVSWTIVSLGSEGATANTWYVSDTESGVAPPGCGASGLNDQSLHIGNVSTSTGAAFSCPTGDCGAAYDATTSAEITNKRVESPTINCSGQTNITVDFNYIENGQGVSDDCSFWYFDGSVWTNLDPMAKTPTGCSPQGQWTSITTINLPASADNNPNVKIGYLWINDGDGMGSDPSVAIDDITLTNNSSSGPTAILSSTDSTLCEADCIDFNDLSTGSPTGWNWYFPGATVTTSILQNPTNICYNTAGSFDVSLVVTDGITSDSLYLPGFINVVALPTVVANASPSTTVCNGDLVTLTGSGASTYSWDNGVTDGVAFSATSTTTYTVTGTDASGCFNTDQVTITVNNCSVPTASFTTSTTTICSGDSITFTDNSTGTNISAWNWTFPAGTPATANTQGPHTVTFSSPGTYNINLSITDSIGTDDTTIVVTVNNCSVPTASFTVDSLTICVGGDILFTDNSTGTNISAWNWTFSGGTPATANTQGPHTVTFSSPGTYSVNLSITDSVGTDDTTIVVNVINCSNVTAGFSMSNTSICVGDSIIFTDASSPGVTIWSWEFDLNGVGGASPSSAINQGPHTVFYSLPGTYDIQLVVYDGTSFDTTSNTITVSDCSPTADFSTPNTNFCEMNCISFSDLSTGVPTIWSWNFPGGNPSTASGSNPGTICYDTAGVYNVSLMVSNQYGTDSLFMPNYITVNNCPPPTAGITMSNVDGKICVDSCMTFTYDLGTGGPPDTLSWTFEGGTPNTYNSNNYLDVITVCWIDTIGAFNVNVAVSNTNGSSSSSDSVFVNTSPEIYAGPDQVISIGTSGELSAVVTDTSGNTLSTANGVFSWDPTTDLSCSSCQNTSIIQPMDTTTYMITYTDEYGCSVSDVVTVFIQVDLNIGVPSAFSPNGDGSNDILYVKGTIVIETMSFTIYNRYGQQVFSTTDKEQGWDGTHNGKELNPGVFVYYLNVTFIDGSSREMKGNVTLVK